MSVDYMKDEVQEANLKSVRAGVTAKPQELTQGGQYGVGTIQFSANITSGDTLVLNGVTVTANTSGSADTFAVAGTLAGTVANLVTALNSTSASADLQVATASYNSSGSGDTLTLTYDTRTTGSDTYTFDVSDLTAAPTAADAGILNGEGDRAISLDVENTDIQLTQSVNNYFSLADGLEYQKKTIGITAKSTGNAVITPTNFSSGTTITLDTDGDHWCGIFINGAWKTVTSDATVA